MRFELILRWVEYFVRKCVVVWMMSVKVENYVMEIIVRMMVMNMVYLSFMLG